MIDVQGTSSRDEDRELLRHPLVGAVILFTRNFETSSSSSTWSPTSARCAPPPLLVTVDHEGGRVQRFRKEFTLLPPMRTIGREYDLDPRPAAAGAAMRLADGRRAARGRRST